MQRSLTAYTGELGAALSSRWKELKLCWTSRHRRGKERFLHGGRRLAWYWWSAAQGGLVLCTHMACCPSVFPGLLLPHFSGWTDHLDKSRSGDWLDWQEKNRVHVLGWASLRHVKTRGQDCAGSQGDSSACGSWQRRPWHARIQAVL